MKWRDVAVGDVVLVRDGELFPADLLCLHCELSERICYVRTTNLDGETNLKVKKCARRFRLLPFPAHRIALHISDPSACTCSRVTSRPARQQQRRAWVQRS